MYIQDIIRVLENTAPPALQEDFDNTGLLTGQATWPCTGILVSLDVTEAVLKDAIKKGCNLVVAHHPILFRGIKKITGKNYVEQTIIKAIKNDIAIYAIHTNLDNVLQGVNSAIAEKLKLKNCKILQPKAGQLQKLAVFVPQTHADKVSNALFEAGAGNIGRYSECSFSSSGTGSFKAGEDTHPFTGKKGERHYEAETRVEVIFPHWKAGPVLKAMKASHPYEEVAYDLYPLANSFQETGSGLVGILNKPLETSLFLKQLKSIFNTPAIRHTRILKKNIQKIAVCGGAGSFLISTAISAGADVFITADVKYHEFFDADDKLVLADIGHYESEQFTIELLFDILKQNFPNFAVLKTAVNSNPVKYL